MPLPRPVAADRKWWVIGVLGCLAALGVVTWFALSATVGRVSWQTTSYAVTDATSVQISYVVHRPSDVAVTCQLKAMDERFGTVGILDVNFAPGPSPVRTTSTVRTTALAVTGTVVHCDRA